MENAIKRLPIMAFLGAVFMLSAQATTDNAHFYKPPVMYGSSPSCWFGDKRGVDTKKWLTKLDVSYAGGDTKNGWNGNGDTANVLNLTGPTNMIYISENVDKSSPTINKWDIFLAANPGLKVGQGGDFGKLQFSGKFDMQEVGLSLRQNILAGFFLEFALPIRELKVTEVKYTDLSPDDNNAGFNKSTFQWIQLKNNLDVLLGDYGLAPLTSSWKESGAGDLSVLLGWEQIWSLSDDWKNYVGLTLKAGVICPTSETHDNGHVFAMPIGYEGNVGLTGFAQVHFGLMRWLGLRIHGSGTYFCEGDSENYHMKTFSKQTGWLKLQNGKAKEEEGTLWHLGADLSFDHFVGGLTARVGYSYTQQDGGELKPANGSLFTDVNDNPLFREWYMHTMNFVLDYDFSVHAKKWHWAPRISGFYNLPIDGKSAFKTQVFGGNLGVDIRWCL